MEDQVHMDQAQVHMEHQVQVNVKDRVQVQMEDRAQVQMNRAQVHMDRAQVQMDQAQVDCQTQPQANAPVQVQTGANTYTWVPMLQPAVYIWGKEPLTDTTLVSTPLCYQKQMLGECLITLIEKVQASLAHKLTGMFLEMDSNDVIHLLESPQALHTKVTKAVAALRAPKINMPTAAGLYGVPGNCRTKLHMIRAKPQAATEQSAVRGQEPPTASMLAAAPSQDQKQMLGECLYHLIQDIQPSLVGKVTGMLLELDNTEVLHLQESPEDLRARMDEAVAVYKAYLAEEAAKNPVTNTAGVSNI